MERKEVKRGTGLEQTRLGYGIIPVKVPRYSIRLHPGPCLEGSIEKGLTAA